MNDYLHQKVAAIKPSSNIDFRTGIRFRFNIKSSDEYWAVFLDRHKFEVTYVKCHPIEDKRVKRIEAVIEVYQTLCKTVVGARAVSVFNVDESGIQDFADGKRRYGYGVTRPPEVKRQFL